MSFPRKARLRGLSVSIAQLILYRVLQGVRLSRRGAPGYHYAGVDGNTRPPGHGVPQLGGLGTALLFPPNHTALISSVPFEHRGVAAGIAVVCSVLRGGTQRIGH